MLESGRAQGKRGQRGVADLSWRGRLPPPPHLITDSVSFPRNDASDNPPSLIGPHLLSPAGFGPASDLKRIQSQECAP